MGDSQTYFSENKVEKIAQKMNAISKQYEQTFVDFGKQMFIDIADIDDASNIVFTCVDHIEKAIKVYEKFFPSPTVIACKEGCHYCCYFPIDCPPQVAIDIARSIKKNLTIEEQQTLCKKMGIDIMAREKPFFRAPCPFLDENKSCSIYEKRPLSCRWFTSPDAEYCRQSVKDGSNIPQHPTGHRIYQVATTMLLACAKDQKKYDKQVGFIPSVLEILNLSEDETTWKGYKIISG